VAYIFSGFFLGHVYRSTTLELQDDLGQMAQAQLSSLLDPRSPEPVRLAPAVFALYKDGRRFAGDPDAPRRWRDFWPCVGDGDTAADSLTGGATFFADPEGQPTVLGCATSGDFGVLARFDGDLEAELSSRAGIWIELGRADEQEKGHGITFVYGQRDFTLQMLRPRSPRESILRFFGHDDPAEPPGLMERPVLVWLEPTRPFRDPATGAAADDHVAATLVSTTSALMAHLVPPSPEVGFFVYLLLLTVFLATLNVYIIALMMATMMIFGLSKAVNRLTEATRRVQRGDFGARIQVYRKDQLGALQDSFNRMAANLEGLVQEAAQKEIFERELELARQMQQGLLPDTLRAPHPLAVATYFRPSRA
ncbi:MAG: HAMP domain-containing protein, partial [Holophagales bacterium]|nr:HAMP domain-containing protein [Holophagales bacterium]